MGIRAEVVNAIVQADDDRLTARAMPKGPDREAAWQQAMADRRSAEADATREEKAAAEAVMSTKDGYR